MQKKKVCKKCHIFYEGHECPVCKISNPSTSWKGRVYIIDVKKSEIAKKMGIKIKGEYAIKL